MVGDEYANTIQGIVGKEDQLNSAVLHLTVQSIRSVSYTHLDVYKRQIKTHTQNTR